ncbi:MAG: hypothetical protein WBG30_13225 [Psychrilyobacter sp.]
MEFQGTISNWVKFTIIILDNIKELQFMGETYTDKKISKSMQGNHI